jgi:hypothetical protein
MPRTHQIQRGIGRRQTADVEHPGEVATRHQQIAGQQVAVGHHVWAAAAWQFPQRLPHPLQDSHVQQAVAALEARPYPAVVRLQIATSATPGESPTVGDDCPHARDEFGQIACERGRFAGVLLRGHGAREPCLHRPWQRVPRSGLAKHDRFWCGESCPACQLTGGFRLGEQLVPHDVRPFLRLEEKASRKLLPDPEDGVDRPVTADRANRQCPPLRELLVDERAHGHSPVASLARGGRRDGQLAGVHVHGRSLTQLDRCLQPNSDRSADRFLSALSQSIPRASSVAMRRRRVQVASVLNRRWHNGK